MIILVLSAQKRPFFTMIATGSHDFSLGGAAMTGEGERISCQFPFVHYN